MKTFWLFRTNLRIKEYYHEFTTVEELKQKCHDFYLLQCIWFLENNVYDEVVIWRLAPSYTCYMKELTIIVNGKKFIQRFVDDFSECLQFPAPQVTLFRGGFNEYNKLTKHFPGFFGLKLYCGTSNRVVPQGGKYDRVLVEDSRDLASVKGSIPFYKTANPHIFHPTPLANKYDICWPCNFSQAAYKGQRWFIEQVAKSDYLQSLKIVHVGNKPARGEKWCKKAGVTNIEFWGHVDRATLNGALNQSKIGLVTSNIADGCPRVVTEILCSGTPLIFRCDTRVLPYYTCDEIMAQTHVFMVESSMSDFPDNAITYGYEYKASAIKDLPRLALDTICRMNVELWGER
jgi:hypothetical protein